MTDMKIRGENTSKAHKVLQLNVSLSESELILNTNLLARI